MKTYIQRTIRQYNALSIEMIKRKFSRYRAYTISETQREFCYHLIMCYHRLKQKKSTRKTRLMSIWTRTSAFALLGYTGFGDNTNEVNFLINRSRGIYNTKKLIVVTLWIRHLQLFCRNPSCVFCVPVGGNGRIAELVKWWNGGKRRQLL